MRARLRLNRPRPLRLFPIVIHSAVLAMMVLGGTTVRAASFGMFHRHLARVAPTGPATGTIRSDTTKRESKAQTYSLGATTELRMGSNSDSFILNKSLLPSPIVLSDGPRTPTGIRSATNAGAEWSPRTTNGYRYDAALFDFGPKRSVGPKRRPLAVPDERLRISRFTFSRKRIAVVLVTPF